MRKQEYIYSQNTHCGIRNKTINNINTSSDICIFSEPQYYVSGATKIPFSIESCDLSGTSFSGMIATASATCFSAYSMSTCFCGLTWTNLIYANSGLTYSADILTTTSSSNTLSQGVYNNSIYTALSDLDYSFTTSGSTILVSKPYGVHNLELDLCVDMIYNTACTSGTCGVCTNTCVLDYPYLDSGSTGVYLFGYTASSIDFDFVFTGNMDSFDVTSSSDTIFNYSIFKYDPNYGGFRTPALYTSKAIQYSAVSATSSVTVSISTMDLKLDGDYLIKGNFTYNVCTDILRRLGVRNDTQQLNGSMYSLYDENIDYYFVAITSAATPTFLNGINNISIGRLFGFSMFPGFNGQTAMTFNVNFIGPPMVALNGLVLADNIDYILTSTTILFSSSLKTSDVVTMIGVVGNTSYAIQNDLITITNPIASGVTNGQGTNSVYFNTTTGKYEVYTSLAPANGNDIVITLNGLVLATNIEYYQSITNSKRFILEGVIQVGDVINLYYFPTTNVVNYVYSNNITVTWEISITPQLSNGEFTLEISTGNTFTTILTSTTVSYIGGVSVYNANVILSGTYGTNLYYRIKNNKNYENITGDIIATEVYSEIIPIIIATNAINTY